MGKKNESSVVFIKMKQKDSVLSVSLSFLHKTVISKMGTLIFFQQITTGFQKTFIRTCFCLETLDNTQKLAFKFCSLDLVSDSHV